MPLAVPGRFRRHIPLTRSLVLRMGMNPDPPRGQNREDGPAEDSPRASRRIASGTAVRAVGELLAKPASLLFYIVLARKLGDDEFGEFIFGLSLSTVLLAAAGLGTKDLVARQVARRHERVDVLLWNVLVLKGLMALALMVAIGILVTVLGYSIEARLAILVVSLGVAFEYETSIFSSVFQAYERQQHIATSLLINRTFTAAAGIGALLAGAGLVPVSILFTVGSALGLLSSYVLMQRRVVRPNVEVDPSRWRELLRAGLPLGILEVASTASMRSSVVLLGILAAGSVDVGQYGAAFRLIEATLFIPWSLSSAMVPWFSRHGPQSTIPLKRGFELALKFVIAAMMPLALVLGIYADEIVNLLYGDGFEGAVTPLQVLAPMTVLWGVNSIVSSVLIGRNSPRFYLLPAAASIVLNAVLSVVLIPDHGAIGAAAATVPSVALLAILTVTSTSRLTGAISLSRTLSAPIAAAAVGAAVAVGLAGIPWIVAAIAVVAAYLATFTLVERLIFPGDFAFLARALPRFGGRGPTPVAPGSSTSNE